MREWRWVNFAAPRETNASYAFDGPRAAWAWRREADGPLLTEPFPLDREWTWHSAAIRDPDSRLYLRDHVCASDVLCAIEQAGASTRELCDAIGMTGETMQRVASAVGDMRRKPRQSYIGLEWFTLPRPGSVPYKILTLLTDSGARIRTARLFHILVAE